MLRINNHNILFDSFPVLSQWISALWHSLDVIDNEFQSASRREISFFSPCYVVLAAFKWGLILNFAYVTTVSNAIWPNVIWSLIPAVLHRHMWCDGNTCAEHKIWREREKLVAAPWRCGFSLWTMNNILC